MTFSFSFYYLLLHLTYFLYYSHKVSFIRNCKEHAEHAKWIIAKYTKCEQGIVNMLLSTCYLKVADAFCTHDQPGFFK